jgi:predicted hydrocarbon binding protein
VSQLDDLSKLRIHAEAEIQDFLQKSWHKGFELWLSVICDMQMAMENVIPYDVRRGGQPLIYDAGVRSGKYVGKWILDTLDLSDKGIKERTCYSDAFFTYAGIGKLEFVKEPKRRLRFKGGTYFASRCGKTARPVCYYVAGFIAGATEILVGKKVSVKEVKCTAAGDTDCEFVIE